MRLGLWVLLVGTASVVGQDTFLLSPSCAHLVSTRRDAFAYAAGMILRSYNGTTLTPQVLAVFSESRHNDSGDSSPHNEISITPRFVVCVLL